mgnify:CR=1 FL=1
MKEEIRLPEKLSDYIKLALKDEKKVFDSPLYEMDMETYHSKTETNGLCRVCFAGAVIAGTLKTPHQNYAAPTNFDIHTRTRLRALDEIRRGRISMALDQIDIPEEMHPEPYFMGIENYYDNREGWRKDMFRIANHLQAQSL